MIGIKIFGVFFGLAMILVVNSCRNGTQDSVAKNNDDDYDINRETILDLEAYVSENGRYTTKINGDSVLKITKEHDSSYLEFFNNMKGFFYKKNGNSVRSSVSCKYAKMFENQNQDVILRKKVIVRNAKNEVLRTEELFWNPRGQYFYTNKYFTFSSPSQTIRGVGMRAQEDLSQIQTYRTSGKIAVNNKGNSGSKKSNKKSMSKKDQMKIIDKEFDF